MRIRVAVPEKYVEPDVINAALEAVTRLDHAMIHAGDAPVFDPENPGVRWRPENMGDEHFDNAADVIARGWGDCDDLAPWRAASLRATGEDPGATAIVVPSGPNMFHAIVRRSDGSNDDPSADAGMKAKSVVGDGESLISVWACDPHDAARMYYGSLAPTVAPITPHCGPTFAVRPVFPPRAPQTRINVVGYEARVDCPVVGSRLVRVRSYHRHRPRHHRSVHGACPYALSATLGGEGWSRRDALAVACAGAMQVGVAAGTASPADKYKLFTMHRLLAGHHPSDVVVELAQMMTQDHAQGVAAHHVMRAPHVHGYVVGDVNDFLQTALGVVQSVAPALASIPGVGDVLSATLPLVQSFGGMFGGGGGGGGAPAAPGAPAPGLSPQPAALAATQHTAAHHPSAPTPGTTYAHAPGVRQAGLKHRPAMPTGRNASSTQAASATPAASTAAQAAQPGQATAMSWDALSAMHQGNYHGTFGPFVVTF